MTQECVSFVSSVPNYTAINVIRKIRERPLCCIHSTDKVPITVVAAWHNFICFLRHKIAITTSGWQITLWTCSFLPRNMRKEADAVDAALNVYERSLWSRLKPSDMIARAQASISRFSLRIMRAAKHRLSQALWNRSWKWKQFRISGRNSCSTKVMFASKQHEQP